MEFAIKAIGDFRLNILGVPFGGPNAGRDSDGEFFDRDTKTYADIYNSIPLVTYHGIGDKSPEVLGVAKYARTDERGHWYIADLDPSNPNARSAMEAAREGKLFASSGSIGHLVRKIFGGKLIDQLGNVISQVVQGFREGQVLVWPVAELSVIDQRKDQEPANLYAVAEPAMKTTYSQAGIDLPEFPKSEAAEALASPGRSGAGAKPNPTKSQGANMTEVATEAQLAAARAAGRAELEAELAAKAAREKEIEDAKAEAVKAARTKWEEDNKDALDAAKAAKTAAGRLADGDGADGEESDGGDGLPTVSQRKFGNTYRFDHVDDGALAFSVATLDAAKASGRSRGGASEDAKKALAIRMVTGKDEGRHNVRTLQAMKAGKLPLKANEINQTTLANFGDEWVGEANSSALWRRIVEENAIIGKIPSIEVPRGTEAINIPLEGAPPTFYKVAQAADLESGALSRPAVTVPASLRGTGKRKLELNKVGARAVYAGELEEQSFVPWAEELRNSIVQEGQAILEHIAIDGDTTLTASTNINDIAGTPAGNEAFLVADGFRKLALVTNTSNSRDAGSTFEAVDFLETVKLLGLGGRNALSKVGVEFIVDAWTHWASLNLAEVKTRDVFVAPTVEQGTLTGIWGYKVNATGNMHRANQDATYGLKVNAAGKIDRDTVANNTLGAILAVRFDQWRAGFQRRMTIEVTRYPESDASQIVALAMFGLVNRDAEASAISRNVKI